MNSRAAVIPFRGGSSVRLNPWRSGTVLPVIKNVYFSVCSTCNVRCRMCAMQPGGHTLDGEFFIDLDSFKRMWGPSLPYLANAYVRVDASGGDVLTHPHYGEMATFILPHVHRLALLTNGTRLVRLPESALNDKLWLTVSLEGATAQMHESLVENAKWDTIWSGIDRAVSRGAHLACNQVLMSMNRDHVLPLIDLLADRGAYLYRLIQPVPNWRKDWYALPIEEAMDIALRAKARCEQRGLEFADSVTPFAKMGTACLPTPLCVCRGNRIMCPAAFEAVSFGRLGYSRCLFYPGKAMYAQAPTTVIEAFVHAQMVSTRQDLLKGRPDDICRACLERNRLYDTQAPGNFVRVLDEEHPYADYEAADGAVPRHGFGKPPERECLDEGDKTRRLIESVPSRLSFYVSHGLEPASCDMLDIGAGIVPVYAVAFLPTMRTVTAYDPRADQWDYDRVAAHNRLLNTVDLVMSDVPGANLVRANLGGLAVCGEFPADERFDFVFCTSVLEHVGNWRALLCSALDCMRPEGLLWLSWAPWFSWQGAHVGGRDTRWEHLLRDADGFAAALDEGHGANLGKTWLEERASDYGYINTTLCVTDVEHCFGERGDIDIVTHSTPLWHADDLDNHPERETLEAQAERIDLLCKSDNWLVRKVDCSGSRT